MRRNHSSYIIIFSLIISSCSTSPLARSSRKIAQSTGETQGSTTCEKPYKFILQGSVPLCVVGGDESSFLQQPTGEIVKDKESYDVIIVGGGLAGLSAGIYLSDQNKKVLVLEKEATMGGLAAYGNESNGIVYDRGAAYWTRPYLEEYNILKHIHLGNYQDYKIAEPIDSYYWNGNFYPGIWEEKTLRDLPGSFALFKHELQWANRNKLIPNQPFEEFAKMDLDRITAAEWIRSMPDKTMQRRDPNSKEIFQRYATDFASGKIPKDDPMNGVIGLMDLYCRSALGANADKVSAMAFANFYISEIEPRYTSEYGTGIAAKKMLEDLEKRNEVKLSRGSPVTSIENKTIGNRSFVEVNYLHKDDSGILREHQVQAKYLVFSTQLKLASQLIKDFGKTPATKEQAEVMDQLGYSHYSVHNFEVQGHPYRATYDTWTRSQDYSEEDFTDVILGRWTKLNGYRRFRNFNQDPNGNAIISIYHPLSEKWMGSGYNNDQAALIAETALQRMISLYSPLLKKLDPDSAHHPERSNLDVIAGSTSRWPYSVHVAEPGHFRTKAKIIRKPFGNIIFANNNMGTPAFEEALFRGHCAANNILKRIDPKFKNETWSKCVLDPK